MDEVTSSLDSVNEFKVINAISNKLHGKTIVLAAHRLSSIKHADLIIVMQKGKIVEVGHHQQLMDNKGRYFQLFKNQISI